MIKVLVRMPSVTRNVYRKSQLEWSTNKQCLHDIVFTFCAVLAPVLFPEPLGSQTVALDLEISSARI